MQELVRQVKAWARRSKLQSSVKWVFFGLAAGLGLALIVALTARTAPILKLPQLAMISGGLALAGLLIAWVAPWFGGLRRPTLAWARRFDQQFNLHQRISTALELESGALPAKNPDIRKLQMQDALRSAARVQAGRMLPLRITWRDVAVCAVLLIGLLLAMFLPNPQLDEIARREALEEQKKEQAAEIEELKQLIQNNDLLDQTAKDEALEALDEAQQTLQDESKTADEALNALNEAQDKLNEIEEQLAGQQNDALQQAGQNMTPDELTNELSDSLANRDFEQAANELRELGDNNSSEMSQQEQQRVADQLEQMARNTESADPNLSQELREAAQQMREGNTEQAQQQLDQAAQRLEQAGRQERAADALDEAQNSVNQARRQLSRSTGRQDPTESGQPGQGEGEGQGQGQGNQTDQFGQQDGPPQGGDASGQGQPRSGHSEDTGTANEVWAPQRLQGNGAEVALDSTAKAAPDPRGKPNQGPAGQSTVPYQQVYADYKKTADDAIQNGDVPAELRDYVREYFTQLNPGRSR